MRFHHDCGGEAFRAAGRFFRFGPFDFDFDFDGGSGGFGGSGGRRGRSGKRMFEAGELRLVLLKLIADEPRHGYELIRGIEEMTGGRYAPSPGIVYPTLTMLEDMGLIAERKSADSKKIYEATEAGRDHLAEHESSVEDLIDRLEGHGRHRRSGQRPEIGRAIANLMTALRHRVARDGFDDRLLDEIVDILDEAAQRIERVRGEKKRDD